MDAANDLALLKTDGKFSPLSILSSRSAQLGGTVATVGFPDIGLQGFKKNTEGRRQNEETKPHPVRANRYFFILHFPSALPESLRTATK